MSKSDTTLYELPRDVLTVLRRELCDARAGTWELRPDANGVDVDFCEMLEETIALIERLTHE